MKIIFVTKGGVNMKEISKPKVIIKTETRIALDYSAKQLGCENWSELREMCLGIVKMIDLYETL